MTPNPHSDLARRPRHDAHPSSILAVIYQGLGDLVLATPALRAIRDRFPQAELCIAGKLGVIDILANEPFIDRLVSLPSIEESNPVKAMRALWAAMKSIREARYDLVLNLTTLLSLGTFLKCQILNILASSGQTRRIGGGLNHCLCLSPRKMAIRYRHKFHESEMKFQLMNGLVSPPKIICPRLTLPSNSPGTAARLADLRFHYRLVGLFAGGQRQTRQWPLERFRRCAELLGQDENIRLVILGGPAEIELNRSLTDMLGPVAIDVTNCVPIRELPAVIDQLDVLLTNDSGPMHVAAAVGTPLVAIFGAEAPERYRPIAPPTRARVFHRPFRCSPCRRSHCPHRRCMDWITPEVAAHAIQEMLTRRSPADRHTSEGDESESGLECLAAPRLVEMADGDAVSRSRLVSVEVSTSRSARTGSQPSSPNPISPQTLL